MDSTRVKRKHKEWDLETWKSVTGMDSHGGNVGK
jgi:hypothetical protein